MFGALLFAWSGPSKQELADKKHFEACKAAEFIIVDWSKRHGNSSFAFPKGSISPAGTTISLELHPGFLNEWPKALLPRVSRRYYEAFQTQMSSNGIGQCPNAANAAAREGHNLTDSISDLAIRNIYGSLVIYKQPIVQMSLPYLSEDGREAMIIYSLTGGSDSSYTSLVLYRKNALDTWQMVDEIKLWIS